MSDDVIRKLPRWFIDRMRAWAEFRTTGGAYGVPSSWPSDGPMEDGRPYGPRYFRLIGSKHETQVCIDELPARYRQAVKLFWIFEGETWRAYARREGMQEGSGHKTFKIWVRKGHVLLIKDFRDRLKRRQDRAAERARLARVDNYNYPKYHPIP